MQHTSPAHHARCLALVTPSSPFLSPLLLPRPLPELSSPVRRPRVFPPHPQQGGETTRNIDGEVYYVSYDAAKDDVVVVNRRLGVRYPAAIDDQNRVRINTAEPKPAAVVGFSAGAWVASKGWRERGSWFRLGGRVGLGVVDEGRGRAARSEWALGIAHSG